ncbi:MAG: disulfide bond formation protein B [Pseudomonadota bacterium]
MTALRQPLPWSLPMRAVATTGLLIMVVAISGAWAFQIIGGVMPCPLCLEQRVPYYIAIPVAALALLMAKHLGLLSRLLLLGAGAAMVWGAGLGIYHAGAEWAFWDGPNTCGGTAPDVTDASNLLAVLEETTLVSCTQDTGRFLGLSFAGWNVVAALSAAALLIVGAFRPLPSSSSSRSADQRERREHPNPVR